MSKAKCYRLRCVIIGFSDEQADGRADASLHSEALAVHEEEDEADPW